MYVGFRAHVKLASRIVSYRIVTVPISLHAFRTRIKVRFVKISPRKNIVQAEYRMIDGNAIREMKDSKVGLVTYRPNE